MSLLPGIPYTWMGSEQGCQPTEDGFQPILSPELFRVDLMTNPMWASLGKWIAQSDVPDMPAQLDLYNMTSPHFLWTQQLMAIRQLYPVLYSGDYLVPLYVTELSPVVFSRLLSAHNQSQSFLPNSSALIALYTQVGPCNSLSQPIPTGWPSGSRIINVLDDSEQYDLDGNGSIPHLLPLNYTAPAKVFVLVSEWRPLLPRVVKIEPAHDSLVPASAMICHINITLSQPVNVSTICPFWTVNDQLMGCSSFESGAVVRVISFSVNCSTPGLYRLRYQGSTLLGGYFHSRFRKASPYPDDLVAASGMSMITTHCLNATFDPNGPWPPLAFNLFHHCSGCTSYRVSGDFGASWSTWIALPLQFESDWSRHTSLVISSNQISVLINTMDSTITLSTQYWMDGSAAYSCQLTLSQNQVRWGPVAKLTRKC